MIFFFIFYFFFNRMIFLQNEYFSQSEIFSFSAYPLFHLLPYTSNEDKGLLTQLVTNASEIPLKFRETSSCETIFPPVLTISIF